MKYFVLSFLLAVVVVDGASISGGAETSGADINVDVDGDTGVGETPFSIISQYLGPTVAGLLSPTLNLIAGLPEATGFSVIDQLTLKNITKGTLANITASIGVGVGRNGA